MSVILDQIARTDIKLTTLQVSPSSGFDVSVISLTGSGQPAMMNVVVPGVTGDFVRARRTDFIGDGPWSVAVPVTSGALISSSPWVGQGSLLPTIDTGAYTGALFAYTSTTSAITWKWAGSSQLNFALVWPNGYRQTIVGSNKVFSGLTASTTYYFLMYLVGGTLPGAYVQVDGPYTSNTNSSILANQTSDGHIPLANGYLAAVTTSSGTGGGGGGGSDGGCYALDVPLRPLGEHPIIVTLSKQEDWVILTADNGETIKGSPVQAQYFRRGAVSLKDVVVGDLAVTEEGEVEIVSVEHVHESGGVKQEICMTRGHLVWAGTKGRAFLAHNILYKN